MRDTTTYPGLPTDVRAILDRFNQFDGTRNTVVRLDWTDQTLTIVGRLARDRPFAADRGAGLDRLDSHVQTAISDAYDLPVIDRILRNGNFRYHFDVASRINERPIIHTFTLDDDPSSERASKKSGNRGRMPLSSSTQLSDTR